MARLRPSLLFNRGELTDWLLTNLGVAGGPDGPVLTGTQDATPILLGDGEAPPAGGWPGGEPTPAETFVPYTVLITAPANPSPGTPVGSAEADSWECSYRMPGYGALRAQADWVADKVRISWDALPSGDLEFGAGRNWHICNYRVTAMGGVTRDDQLTPPLWTADTQLALTISRRHGS